MYHIFLGSFLSGVVISMILACISPDKIMNPMTLWTIFAGIGAVVFKP